jgi:two-component system sensor histidine kinase RegB
MRVLLPQSLPLSAPLRNLQHLCVIRMIAWSGETLATAYGLWGLKIDLAYIPLAMILLMGLLLIIASLLRLRHPWPIAETEFLLHILADVLLLWAFIYFTGGASNPFVSYFLVPLTISAATLPWLHTGVVLLVSLLAYSSLLFHYMPMELLSPAHHEGDGMDANWHILGMWLNFAISAGLIGFFIARMADSLRQQDAILQASREKQMRNEHLIGVAGMAANTAHALGTPLSTMAVLLNEMAHSYQDDRKTSGDIVLLRRQIDICKDHLRKLVQVTEQLQQQRYDVIPADRFFMEILRQWQDRRPSANYSFAAQAASSAPPVLNALPLTQAIENLLDNAADASPQPLEINADWDKKTIFLRIRDHGPGVPPDIAHQIGKTFISNKPGGLGLGLFLSHATLDLFAGSVKLYPHAEGGTLTEVCLPIAHAIA